MVYRLESGRVASPRRGLNDRGRQVARSAHPDNGLSSPKARSTFWLGSGPDVAPRPVTPAEAAQARLFERMLHAELVQLQHREKLMALRAPQRGPGGQPRLEQAQEVRARIRELNHLLKGLRDRFSEPAKEGSMSPRSHSLKARVS
jgi:hypothetical protein